MSIAQHTNFVHFTNPLAEKNGKPAHTHIPRNIPILRYKIAEFMSTAYFAQTEAAAVAEMEAVWQWHWH